MNLANSSITWAVQIFSSEQLVSFIGPDVELFYLFTSIFCSRQVNKEKKFNSTNIPSQENALSITMLYLFSR